MKHTLESLQAMKDEEIINLVATQVMGFELQPIEKVWENGYAPDVLYWKVPEGIQINTKPEKESDPWPSRLWNPLSGSWDDTMSVVKKVNEKKRIDMTFLEGGTGFGLLLSVGEGRVRDNIPCSDPSPQRAICFASILATQ